jgi:hypothetical protein
MLACLMFLCYAAAVSPTPAGADDSRPETEWRGGPHLGFTPYSGMFGAELSKGHYALSVGFPLSVGLKYYSDPHGDRWFAVAHVMHLDVEEDYTVNNVRYDHVKDTLAGAGFGYRWRWADHWDLTASLSAVYQREQYTSATASRTEQSVWPFPGISFGYTF